MLFFLELAAKMRFVIDHYADDAIGVMGENNDGKIAMLSVTLRPLATFSGERLPTQEQIEQLHHKAHELCFIANSIKTRVEVAVRFQ